MPAGKSVWGIDIGQCALKAIKLRQVGDRIEAVGFDVIEHAKILSQPDADRYQLVRNALDKFVSRNEIDGDKIVISVPGHTSFARFIKLPPVESKRIPEIVDYEAAQQIPFNIDDVEWAWQRIPTPDTSEVEVGIFAIKKDIIDDLLENFKEAGISVDVVQMAPLALYNFLETDQHVGTGTTILVDIGAENTDLIVADGHRIWLRNIHIGGNNFTEALVKSFKLTFAKAENLKRTAANSKYARQIFQAMRPVFSDLVAEVQRSIGFYTSLHRDARIERIVGLGNAFRLPGLQKFLQQNLQVEVEKVEAFGTLGSSQVTSAPAFRDNLLSFAVSYGLALQGLGLTPLNNNLLPLREVRRISWDRKRMWFIGAAMAAAACWGLCFFRVTADGSTLDDSKAEGSVYEREIRKYDNGRRSYRQEKANLQKWINQMNRYRVRRAEYLRLWPDVLDRITRELPTYDVTKIYQDPPIGTPRGSRRQIFIGDVSVVFVDKDVDREFEKARSASADSGTSHKVGGQPGAPAAGASTDKKTPGFLITIEGTTPFGKLLSGGTEFIQKNFVDKLLKEEKGTVNFSKAEIIWRQLEGASTGTGYGGPSFGGTSGGMDDPLKPSESREKDLRFKILAMVRTTPEESRR